MLIGVLLLALFSLLLAVSALVIAKFRHRRTYTSEAWLAIRPERNLLLKSDADDKFQREQIAILSSSRLLVPLARDPRIRQTPELAQEPNVAAALEERLNVRNLGQSDIYVVSFTSVSPRHAQLVVQSVIDAYLALQNESEAEQAERPSEQQTPLRLQVVRPATLPDNPD